MSAATHRGFHQRLFGNLPFKALGLAMALCTGLSANPASAATVTQWQSTLNTAYTPAVATAALPDDAPLHLAVSLKLQNRADLESFIKNLYAPGNPQFGHYLTPGQFTSRYAPSAEQAQQVVDYLRAAGLGHVQLSDNRMLVTATATAAVAQKAFNTTLVQFQKDGRTVRAYTRDVQVPAPLGDLVLAVVGLENVVQMKTGLQQQRERAAVFPPLTVKASQQLASALKLNQASTKADTNASSVGPALTVTAFPPTAWDVAYDAGNSLDGSGTTIAISTYGDNDSVVVDDLRQMERQYGLPYVPVEVRIPPNAQLDPSSSGDDEWDLDSQSSTAIAHNVKKLILYTGDGSTDQLLWQYNQFATLADAMAGNMSYGTCELDAATGLLLPAISSSDQAFMQAVAEGLSWHASTGDDGGVCSPINALGAPLAGVPLLANYPDSSPYVVAVGGTSLITDASFNYSSEIAWTSGGGGISVLEAAPAWQSGIVPSSTLTSIPGVGSATGAVAGGTGVGRGVPDISLDAGIYLPEAAVGAAADTIVGGSHLAVVGTSLSSPLAVGVWARMQSAHCNKLGFAAPAYYALDTAGGLMSTATGFHDVTEGTNGDYVATTGWDYTTGFGSPDLAKVNAALPAAPAGCNPNPAPPVAALSAAVTTAAGSLATTFDGGASTNPAGDSISYYTLDFGDDTLPVQQTSPAFASHTYSAPGIYTASLTVRNTAGAVSTPATQTLTVTGMPPACTAAGKVVMTSPAGSASVPVPVPIVGSLLPVIPDPVPGEDLLSVSVAEPAAQPGKLVFTIKVDTLSTVPPAARWAVFFTLPGDTIPYYVAMNSDTGTPTYTYGQRGTVGGIKLSVAGLLTVYNQIGTLDTSSTYKPDGTITLVLDKSALKLQTGDTLQALYASVAEVASLPPTIAGISTELPVGETVDATGSRFGYTLIGNELCANGIVASSTGSSGGSGTTGTGSSGTGGTGTGTTGGTGSTSGGTASGHGRFGGGAFGLALLPLAAAALRRRRRR